MHLSNSFKHVMLLYLSILILFFHQKTYLLQFPLITCQGRYAIQNRIMFILFLKDNFKDASYFKKSIHIQIYGDVIKISNDNNFKNVSNCCAPKTLPQGIEVT